MTNIRLTLDPTALSGAPASTLRAFGPSIAAAYMRDTDALVERLREQEAQLVRLRRALREQLGTSPAKQVFVSYSVGYPCGGSVADTAVFPSMAEALDGEDAFLSEHSGSDAMYVSWMYLTEEQYDQLFPE